jgi:NTP pyrophosphatase (non-canonical NTP hydrolase)
MSSTETMLPEFQAELNEKLARLQADLAAKTDAVSDLYEDYQDAVNRLNTLEEQVNEKLAGMREVMRLGFSHRNRIRCEHEKGFKHKLSAWSMSDWFLAALGELGEAANIAKKLNRVRDGIPGNKDSVQELHDKLRKELGDVYVYLDLLAQSLGFYVQDAAIEVFESKSREIGYAEDNSPNEQVDAGVRAIERRVLEKAAAWLKERAKGWPRFTGDSYEALKREGVECVEAILALKDAAK